MSTSMIAKLTAAAALEYERLYLKHQAEVVDMEIVWTGVVAKMLAALREPTPEMVRRARDVWQGGGVTDVWRGMIDAALGQDTVGPVVVNLDGSPRRYLEEGAQERATALLATGDNA